MTTDARTIGERVAALRAERGMTQQDLAEAADLHLSTVSRLEQGRTKKPRRKELAAVARALGVTVDDLWGTASPVARATAGPATRTPLPSPPLAATSESCCNPTPLVDVDERIHRALRGDARKVADYLAQTEDLAESEKQLVLDHLAYALDRIEATRTWERARRATVEADLIARAGRRTAERKPADTDHVGA